ncbi:hypothetical protein [Hoeflea sp.]
MTPKATGNAETLVSNTLVPEIIDPTVTVLADEGWIAVWNGGDCE